MIDGSKTRKLHDGQTFIHSTFDFDSLQPPNLIPKIM